MLFLAMILCSMIALAGEAGGFTQPSEGLSQHADAVAPRRVALVIGINRYDDETLPDLRFADDDAQAMNEVLGTWDEGHFDQIVPLTGRVSREAIWAAYDQVTRELQRDDVFLIYFSGHGTKVDRDGRADLYLMPSDARLADVENTAISVPELLTELDLLSTHRRVVVLDTCYSGTGRSRLSEETRKAMEGTKGAGTPPTHVLEVRRFEARLFAADVSQPAREDEALGHGVFTYHLLDALRRVDGALRADLDGDGLVDVLEAFAYAQEHTITSSGGLQVPWMSSTLVGPVEVVLSGDPASAEAKERAVVLSLSRLEGVAPMTLRGAVAPDGTVEPGWPVIEVARGEELVFQGRVRVRSGDRVVVDPYVEGRAARRQLGGGVMWTGDTFPVEMGTVLHPWSPSLSAAWWPADPKRGRWVLGATATGSGADLPAMGPLWATTFRGSVSYVWGHRVQVGPTLGAGFTLMIPEDTDPKLNSLCSAGLHLELPLDRVSLVMQGGVWGVAPRIDDALRWGLELRPSILFTF